MPIILRCACGKEISRVYPLDQGWTIEPQIGGTKGLCPECRQKETEATNRDNEALARLTNLLRQQPQPVNLTGYGKRLFQLFREEQRSHGREGCLCAECQGDMVNALKKIEAQEALSAYKKPAVEIITRPITPASTLQPSEPPNDAA